MHEDDEEADMRTQEELMMQHRRQHPVSHHVNKLSNRFKNTSLCLRI